VTKVELVIAADLAANDPRKATEMPACDFVDSHASLNVCFTLDFLLRSLTTSFKPNIKIIADTIQKAAVNQKMYYNSTDFET